MLTLRASFADKLNTDYSIFVTFKYNPYYVEIMKSMPNRTWNGDTKEWEIAYSNYSQLIGTLNSNNIPYNGSEFMKSISDLSKMVQQMQEMKNKEAEIDSSILDNVDFKTQPYDFQKEGISYGLTHDKYLLADDQGCIDGDAIVQVRINKSTFKIPLSKAYEKFHSHYWTSFKARYLNEDENVFGQQDVLDILDKGQKDCYKLVLEDGKELVATPDHEILTNVGYKPLIDLKENDIVLTNGQTGCPECGSTENLITYEYAKFFGYCKKCMYKKLRQQGYKQEQKKIIRGYVFLRGPQYRNHHLMTPNGVPEHQLIAEQKYDRQLYLTKESVHHLDYNKLNNDPDNLVVLTNEEHAKLHSKEKWKHLYNKDYVKGTKVVVVVPKQLKVVKIEHVGLKHVYDIKMKGPHHNFVANGIVVHNCGKSLQASNIARLKQGGKHCLVICGYDSLQFNWVREVETHTNEKARVLGQRVKRNGRVYLGNTKERLEDLQNLDKIEEFFVIMSATTLRQCEKQEYINKKGKKAYNKIFYMADLVEEWCRRGEIGRIIVDEFQVFKNYDSLQTQSLLRTKSCPYKIAATGTPLMNKNIDLFPLFTWLGYERRNYWEFRERYCKLGGFKGKDIIGDKNTPELHQRLSQFMLRRKKEDVLDLPEKVYIDEFLDMDGRQWALYEKMQKLTKAQLTQMKGNKALLLSATLSLRKITCHPAWIDETYTDSVKYERVRQIVHEAYENKRKTIIFSCFTTPFESQLECLNLYNMLKMYNPAMIIGDTKDRMSEVDKFQLDDSCYVIVGSIGAMGTGLTLNAASNVIFMDEPWNRALKDQACDRAHRIGTKNNVNIYTLICKGTVDEGVHKTVMKKGRLADQIIDGVSVEELEDILGGNN